MKKLMIAAGISLLAPLAFAQSMINNPGEQVAQPGNPSDNPLEASLTPPMIPHEIATFTPITPDRNLCIVCHMPQDPKIKNKLSGPTALPASHVKGDKLAPSRYECLLCHAEVLPQAAKK